MGTSADYNAPASWGRLKGEVTTAASDGAANSTTAKRILQRYIEVNGGSARMSRGTGSGGAIGGRAGRGVAQRLAGFIGAVGEVGLAEALRREGLADLIGRSVHEIFSALLDRLGGPASSIDDVDARTALAYLQEDLLRDAETPEDMDRILREHAGNVDVILRDYFGLYLFEQFCRVFYERLVHKKGEAKALGFLHDIKGFIKATLVHRVGERAIANVSWTGPEGAQLCEDIMQATLDVFLT